MGTPDFLLGEWSRHIVRRRCVACGILTMAERCPRCGQLSPRSPSPPRSPREATTPRALVAGTRAELAERIERLRAELAELAERLRARHIKRKSAH